MYIIYLYLLMPLKKYKKTKYHIYILKKIRIKIIDI